MISSNKLLMHLPEHLKERVRTLREGTCRSSFVLYWMCTAMRTDENPALDTAICLANQLSVPLLVYQGLSYRYPFASDRHHTFILEGARDVQKQLAYKNIPYVFHLEKPNTSPILKVLTNMAAMIITEDMPTPYLRSCTQQLYEGSDVPFWRIDTACILPMSLSTKRYERAYSFRDDFQNTRNKRINKDWLNIDLEKKGPLPTLPFDPIDLQTANLNELIAQCPIDHSIPPVRDTQGGSSAGYLRWTKFLHKNIDSYHYKRNDPTSDGSSRMSAYLHYGQVSPFRLAREAYRKGGKGPDKYLDELLIWRELSYHWCDRTSNPGHLDALPEWAQKTLQQETQTHRIGQQSWEQLFRGKSPDELWNMAQRSLLRHGELHNNIRMTWGKMLHSWTESPQQTLRWLIDLNNRLALDGRDPSSYGGLLWCLGLFDRPFPPQKPIFGTVRTRNSNAHKDRLDNESFRMHIERASPTTSTAIVGAGISGLVCAQKLQDQGHSITLFDKARGVGGRASTRISRSDPDWVFDHGLPFVRHTDPRFQLWVRAWENTGVLKKWNGTIINWFPEKTQIWDEEVYVGTPKNSALAEHLAKDLSIEVQQQITAIRYAKKGWFLKTNEEIEHGPFSRLILTLPPEQLYNLLPQRLQLFERKVKSYPQHALMLRFSTPISTSWDAARINHPTLYWMCRESSKPNRPPQEQWSILTQPSWSAKHVDTPLEDLVPSLIEAVQEVLGCTEQPSQHQIHRWRYSQVQNPLNIGSWWNSEYQIGACGDWMHGGSIEGAYLSGVNLAGRIMRQ